MSEKKVAPPVMGPPPKDMAGMDEFRKQMDAALATIVVGDPKADAPTPPAPRADMPVMVEAPLAPLPTAADQALAAYRQSLVGEQARLDALPRVNPLVTGAISGPVPSAFGVSQAELVVRADADPLHVESFKILRRLVAGGSPLLMMMDVPALTKHLTALREKISYNPEKSKATPVSTVVGG